MKKDFKTFIKKAKVFCDGRIFDDYLRCFAYGTDASCYLYVPKVVVFPESEDEIVKLIRLANECETPLCFRGAGSSLSGQSSCEDVLVVANDNWKKIDINHDGSLIKLGCGVIGSDANLALKDFRKKIGPDPATIATALIGGIINNNSSGMCCGVAQNSYQTIKSIRVILHDGTIVDTSDEFSVANFLKTHQDMARELMELREEICADKELKNLIIKKYKIKNTTGYGINSFVDFSQIKDILNHIFVGSEGSLGFVSEVVYKSVEDKKYKGCGLLFYKSLADASKVVVALGRLGQIVSAAEMMDYACLKSVRGIDGIPDEIYQVEEGNTCILLQSESNVKEELDSQIATIKVTIAEYEPALKPLYSDDESVYNGWWKIRKGILPIAAGRRKSETSVITEDLAFEIDKFCEGAGLISSLFEKYGFSEDGIIFGHALAGNLHFVITPNLNNEVEFKNFKALVEEMSQSVVKMGGSIKAEHGTGRMVAPFVELEWGEKAYQINRKIKQIFDPNFIFNPDVIISEDKEIHAKNLKYMNETDDYINFCMECGFCERACPSRFLTLTPRQRIAVIREISRLEKTGESKMANQLKKEYEYLGDETCAACSMCKILCPLGIDTATIALNLRAKNSSKTLKLATKIYDNMSKVVSLAKFGLSTASIGYTIFGAKNIKTMSNKFNSFMIFPYVNEYLPLKNSHKLQSQIHSDEKVVYFTTCINRGFAPSKLAFDKRPIQEVFESLCKKLNIGVIYPKEIDSMCCGKSFGDYGQIIEKNNKSMIKILNEVSEGGKYPIVLDHSACSTFAASKLAQQENLNIYDISEFILALSPRLNIRKISENLLVHNMCAMRKQGKGDIVTRLAKLCTDKNIYDTQIECCGFAGNKGFFTPELNISATKTLKFLPANLKRGFSSSSTCEIGLGSASKIPFAHIAYLVDECSF